VGLLGLEQGQARARRPPVLFVGVDWAEAHHDVCVLAEDGRVLARRRISDDLVGVGLLHELLGEHAEEVGQVVVGIETDRGLLAGALVAAGYQVYAVNPLAVSRYRGRHSLSGAKSDAGDAKVLADLVRTDRHNHRPVAGDSDLAEAVKVLARTHQRLIWSRQAHVNSLRSGLREFYPGALVAFGTDLVHRDALAVLRVAPTPAGGRRLSVARLVSVLRRAGRQRGSQARAEQLRAALQAPQLEGPDLVVAAWAHVVSATVAVIQGLNEQIAALEAQLSAQFARHPDAVILRSLPALGVVLGARLLGEFGDDPGRYASAKARRAYAATAPITRASGIRSVVSARRTGNRRLAGACEVWAFAAISHSPGARRYYDRHRALGASHWQALRALGNRLVGILHGCLASHVVYDEQVAWPVPTEPAAA
jgi:transposase